MAIVDFLREAQVALGTQNLRDFLAPKVEKAFLENLDEGVHEEFLINPPEFTELYEAKYKRHASIGLSHERLQFVGNANVKISVEVMFDDLVQAQRREPTARAITEVGRTVAHLDTQSDVERWRRFLVSLLYPRRAQRLPSASPPAVMFYWPGMIAMRVRIMKVKFRHVLFKAGRPEARAYMASIEMEEEPLERIFSDDIPRTGMIRPWAASSRARRR